MSSDRILVSCAPSGVGGGSNLGMSTVDLAIHNIADSLDLDERLVLSRPWPSHLGDDPEIERLRELDIPLPRITYNGCRLLDSKAPPAALVYWGDFQHGRDFQVQSAKRLRRVRDLAGKPLGVEESETLVENYFLLADSYRRQEVPCKLAMYGGTLFQNGLTELLDDGYLGNLRWLYRTAEFVKVRDPFSASLVASLTDDYESNFLGVDPALLNTRDELLALPQLKPETFGAFDGALAFYFGRSSSAVSERGLRLFLKGLAKATGTDLVPLPWGYFGRGLFRGDLSGIERSLWRRHDLGGEDFTAGDVIAGLARARLVVTDTYHVCINAIRLGVPVVCIYESSPAQERNANMGFRRAWRDKRALLFTTNALSDFLVNADDLKVRRRREETVDHVASLLDSGFEEVAYRPLISLADRQREQIGQLFASL